MNEKNKSEKFKNIPVLIVSGFADKLGGEEDVFILEKPVNLNELVGKVRAII